MPLRKLSWPFSILLFLISYTTIAQHERGLPAIRNYSPKEYGYGPQVWTIIQDKAGILYAGLTGSGIVEYDGHSWRDIESLKNESVYALAMDTAGRIYFGSINNFGYITQNKWGRKTHVSLKQDSANIGTVWFVHTTRSKVYFLTYSAVYEYDIRNQSIQPYEANGDGRFVGSFVENDIYYVRLSEKGLMKIENGLLLAAPHSEFFKSKNPFFGCIINREAGGKIIGTSTNGFFTYDTNDNQPPRPFPLSNADFIVENTIFTSTRVQPNYELLGSRGKGALLIDAAGQELNSYTENTGLQSNKIYASITDNSGNVWLGLDNGFVKTEHGQDISYWNKFNGLRGTVYDICRFKGKLFVATNQQTYYIDQNNMPVPISEVRRGEQGWSFELFVNSRDTLLLLGTSTGIYDLSKPIAAKIHTGLPCLKLVQSRINPARLFATEGDHFISFLYEHGEWKKEGVWEGVNLNIKSAQEEDDGTIWLAGFSKDIVRVEPNSDDIQHPRSVTNFNSKDGLPSSSSYRLFLYQNRVLAGTEKGLYVFNKAIQRFEPYCAFGENFCDGSTRIHNFLSAGNNQVYITPLSNKQHSITLLKMKSNGGYEQVVQPFRRLPELATIDSHWLDNDGTYWIGSNEGLFRYDARKDSRNYNLSFQCLIRKAVIPGDSVVFWGGDSIDASHDGLLDYSHNTMLFEFSAPFFDMEEETRYSYKLIGHDTDWSSWSKQYTKEYTNLTEGQYTFEVRARNIYGVVSSTARYSFTILPPWYRTGWAYAGYVLAMSGIILGYARWRTSYLKSEKVKLEHIILERTKELKSANEELLANERQLKDINMALKSSEIELKKSNDALTVSEEELIQNNEELRSTLDNLKLLQQQLINSEKMASLGQLTSGVAHEINNPLNFVYGGVQGLKYLHEDILAVLKSGIPATAEQCEEITNELTTLMGSIDNGIERATKIITSLRTFSSPIEEISEDASVDVAVSIENAIVLLKSNILDQRITIEKHIETQARAKANASQLNQVLINIINNAMQALATNTGERIISITVSDVLNTISIRIKDNGPGIPKEHQSKIFSPFFTTKEVGKGTGLGLSISYGIIKKHNGTLTFVSEPGEGTEFTITVPKAVS